MTETKDFATRVTYAPDESGPPRSQHLDDPASGSSGKHPIDAKRRPVPHARRHTGNALRSGCPKRGRRPSSTEVLGPGAVDYPGWCDYLRLHVQVKRFAGGTMDQAEHDFVANQLQSCDNQPAVTTTAPTTTTTAPPRSGSCTHWHAGHPKHTHPGTSHDGTHRSGKCAGY